MKRSILMAGILAVACGQEPPQFRGFVTFIERTAKHEARVGVESHAHKMVQRHVLIVTAQTAMVRREGQAETPVSLDALAEKDWVTVWFEGGEKRSYPLEVTARRIMITARPNESP